MGITNLEEVFVHELKDILDAERQLVQGMPKMAKAATNEDLKAAFEEHKSVTEEHVGRLETIFEGLDKAARGKKCVGMEGLVEEGSALINEVEPGSPLDAALISPRPRRWNITRWHRTAHSWRTLDCWAWTMPSNFWKERWTKRKTPTPSSRASQRS